MRYKPLHLFWIITIVILQCKPCWQRVLDWFAW